MTFDVCGFALVSIWNVSDCCLHSKTGSSCFAIALAMTYICFGSLHVSHCRFYLSVYKSAHINQKTQQQQQHSILFRYKLHKIIQRIKYRTRDKFLLWKECLAIIKSKIVFSDAQILAFQFCSFYSLNAYEGDVKSEVNVISRLRKSWVKRKKKSEKKQ